MNKRGQFYIVAAIIIVLVLSGIASVVTYASTRPSPRTIYSLGSDLLEETSRIIDYGIYNSENITLLLHDFTGSQFAPYFLKKTNNANAIFIYGNLSGLWAVRYDTISTGTITADIGGGGAPTWNMETYAERTIDVPVTNPIKVTIYEKDFEFELKNNEMFYFIIAQERDGEVYIEKNE